MPTPGMDWAVIGSGPSGFDLTIHELRERTVLAVNTAICRVPWESIDYALVKDYDVITGCAGIDGDLYPMLLASGVKLVGFNAPREIMGRALSMRKGRPAWHTKIELLRSLIVDNDDPGGDGWAPIDPGYHADGWNLHGWRLGRYTPPWDPVGACAIQYAVNNGADFIEVWGYEGWSDLKMGSGRDKIRATISERYYATLQAVITACPGVLFKFNGDLRYDLTGDNLIKETRP